MADLGYAGSHLTIGAPRFIAAYVSPLVKTLRWDKALVECIANHDKEIEKRK